MLQPTQLSVSKDKKKLTISFKSGEEFLLEAELLRVLSPSAEVQGHSPKDRVLVEGKRNVGIMKIEPTGNYAVRITFDDMHDTGIYSWQFFYDLGSRKKEEWDKYEAELARANKSRDPKKVN